MQQPYGACSNRYNACSSATVHAAVLKMHAAAGATMHAAIAMLHEAVILCMEQRYSACRNRNDACNSPKMHAAAGATVHVAALRCVQQRYDACIVYTMHASVSPKKLACSKAMLYAATLGYMHQQYALQNACACYVNTTAITEMKYPLFKKGR